MGRKQTKADRKQGEMSSPSTSYQVPAVPERDARPAEDLITTTIRYPRYVNRLMEAWLLDHPGHTKTSLLLNGLRALGQPIRDEDLLPSRRRGRR